MNKQLKWCIVNLALLLVLILHTATNDVLVTVILYAFVIVTFILGLLLKILTAHSVKNPGWLKENCPTLTAQDLARSVPRWLDLSYDCLIVTVMIMNSLWGLVLVYTMFVVVQHSALHDGEQLTDRGELV